MRNELALAKLHEVDIDLALLGQFESAYGKIEDEDVQRIISLTSGDVSIEGFPVLASGLMLNAEDITGTNFAAEGLLPLLDAFDNDYICYDLKNSSWMFFNIVDCIEFNRADKLETLLSRQQ